MMSIAETSKPLGLREAHFRAIRRDDLILQSRKPVPLSKTSKKKPPRKGFMRAKKRVKGGFARDKEVQRKFNIKGIAKELKTEIESVEIRPKKSKKQKEDEEVLEIVRDEKKDKPIVIQSVLDKSVIDSKLQGLARDFDEREKRYRRREGIQSEAYFSALADDFDELRQSQRLTQSEPAVQGRSERRTKTQSVIRGGDEVYTTDAQFLGAMPQYESMSDFLKDYPQNIGLIKALREVGRMDEALENELESRIRLNNTQFGVEEDKAREGNAIVGQQLQFRAVEGGGRAYDVLQGTEIGGGTEDSPRTQSRLRQVVEQRKQERLDKERAEYDERELSEYKKRFESGRPIYTGGLADRQQQKAEGLLEHSSDDSLSSGDSVRQKRGLSVISDRDDELASGSLRSDGTSTAEREAVASDLDRRSQDSLATRSSGGSERFGDIGAHRPLETLERSGRPYQAPQPEPEPKKETTIKVKSLLELQRELQKNIASQTSLNADLSSLRRGRLQREERLSQEAPIVEQVQALEIAQRKLERQIAEKQPTAKKPSASERILNIRLGSDSGGGLSTSSAIRVASEHGTDATGGSVMYGVKPRSKDQAQTLLTEMSEQPTAIKSTDHEAHFDFLEQHAREPKLDLSPITPRSPLEETTPRGRGEVGGGKRTAEEEGGGVGEAVGGALVGGAKAVGGVALGVAEGVGGAIREQLPAPQDVARGIARAGAGAVLGAVQGVAEGVSGALGGGEVEPTDV